jgi:putative nucleotidyltransferase with HDIG domain
MSDMPIESNAQRVKIGFGLALALITLAPAILVLILATGTLPDPYWANPEAHFYNVTLIAIVAIAMAVFMAFSATSLRDIRVLLLSIAYLSSSIVLLTHAMTTPGVLVGFNPWVGFSGDFGVLLAATFLALAGSNWTPAFQRKILAKSRSVLWTASTLLIGYFAFAMISAYYGFASSFGFINDERIILAGTLITYALLWLAIFRFVQLYRRNPSPVILAVLASAVLFLETVVTMTNTDLWDASWWLHHVMLFFAFVVVVAGIIVQFSRKSTLRGVLEGLLLRDSIVQVEREYTDAIIALVAAVEARDPYTFGHSENVANISEQIGRRLGLAGEMLEMLHLAALLHDIGKLGIPDQILLKPGRLTDTEFDIIKEHPTRGADIASKIGALGSCVPGIRSHHERLDGSGYPDGLSGDQIPLFARIIAVADCYDAMTSERPYRGPLDTADVLQIIRGESGIKLDSRAVQALINIVDSTDFDREAIEKSTLAAA